MASTRPSPRFGTDLAAVLVVSAIIVSAAGITWYEVTQGGGQAPSPTGNTPGPGCTRIDMSNGSALELNFTRSAPCFDGIPHWGVNIAFSWVSVHNPAEVTLDWSCRAGPQCLLGVGEGEVYNATGTFGSLDYNTSSLGPRWAGWNSLDYTFTAGSAGSPPSTLAAGETVLLRGSVG